MNTKELKNEVINDEIEISIEDVANMIANMLPNEWCEYSYLNNTSNIAFINKINAADKIFDIIKNINYIDEQMINKIESIISEFTKYYINSGGKITFQSGDFNVILTMISGVLSFDKSNMIILDSNEDIIKAKKYTNKELMLSDEINDYFANITDKFKSKHYLLDYYINFYHQHDGEEEQSE